MRTLADMTPEERQACVGMWCEYKDGNGTKLAVIVETWLTNPEACMVYDISCHENRHPLGGDVTPRPDLPRAWAPDGKPLDTDWESITTQPHPRGSWNANPEDPEYFDLPPGTKMRRWVGEWETA